MDTSPPHGFPPRADGSGRPLGELFRELRDEGALLVRQELALARTEVARAGSRAALDTAWITIWAAVAGVGALAVVAGIVVLVGQLVGSYWLGALIVSVVLISAGGGAAMYYLGRLRELQLAPERSIRSVQATGEWARSEATQVKAVLTGDGSAAPANRIAGHWAPPERTLSSSDGRSRSDGEGEKKGAREEKKERAAENPGVLGLLKTTGKEVLSDDVPGQAAKVAYYAFLSLPPAVMMVFALAGFFGGSALADWIRTQASLVLPSSAAGLIESFIQDTVATKAPGPFSIGILLALWGASSIFMGLGTALDTAYDLEKERSWFKRRAIAIGVMIVAVALFLLAGGALLVGPSLAHAIGLFGAA
ncbi:MAG TPA: YhjD/YihY/BrkB family envelope integrity protein, partial [Longimicrobiaceae bacterium]|nr:YhjD/YihY/BrkB family envelope integrity protein [Longimicrobiaceae bacterium]